MLDGGKQKEGSGEPAMWTEGADGERALRVGVLQKRRSTDPSQLEQSRGLHVSVCLGV